MSLIAREIITPIQTIGDFETLVANALGVEFQVEKIGQIQRFSTNGKPLDKAGWAVFYNDEIPGGAFGDWRTGVQGTWCAMSTESMTAAERWKHQCRLARVKEFQRDETAKRRTQAAATAFNEWDAARLPESHAYLTNKGVGAYGIRQRGNRLLVPLMDEAGSLWSLQYISEQGIKRFLPGGRTSGVFHRIDGGERVGIAEGYATAATIHKLTGDTVYIAFNANNLPAVAAKARVLHPTASIIVWADNDVWTKGNPGIEKGKRAATACNGALKIPDFTGFDLSGKPTDWNDLYLLGGVT